MNAPHKKETPKDDQDFKIPDPVALGQALLQAYEKAQPLLEGYYEKIGKAGYSDNLYDQGFDPLNISESYLEFLDRITADPQKFLELQAEYMNDWTQLWQESMMKFLGQDSKTVIQPEKGDKRFKAREWQENALFDFIKQSYLLTCRWMNKSVSDVEGLAPQQKEKLALQTRLFSSAMSPTNFFLTNPEVLKETMKTGGENLVKGLENLIEDLERGGGELKIRTTDDTKFQLGENIATTKGRVVYQNELMQLIQYEPTTKKVFKTPLLIIPPWINKYYILDLRPGNSFIQWAIEQGHSVFCISWVNPGKEQEKKRFEEYMEEGILTALSYIEKETGEKQTNAIGYCLGGTLLAITMAYLAETKKKSPFASTTFLTTLLDFEHAGDMKLFLDDDQIELLDKIMEDKGILPGAELQKTFSLLRANDLIWSFVINNYLMGREPFPFDLLYWNDDCTNMPAAMHGFYLRKMYRDNALIRPGGIKMEDTPIDLRKIETPCYFLSAREDHIAPWMATYSGTQIINGPCTYTLAASGHIGGVVNPPEKNKYCYWTNDETPKNPEEWLENTTQHEGSWWPHWQDWIKTYAGGKVPARKPAAGLEPAPGSYVKMKSG